MIHSNAKYELNLTDSFTDDLVERLNLIKPNLIVNACSKKLITKCCNYNNLSTGNTNINYPFLTSDFHILCWNKNTKFN
jgi:hypothetical protein